MSRGHERPRPATRHRPVSKPLWQPPPTPPRRHEPRLPDDQTAIRRRLTLITDELAVVQAQAERLTARYDALTAEGTALRDRLTAMLTAQH